MPTAMETLELAKDCVSGKRRHTHGEPERVFATVASMWREYLTTRNRFAVSVTPADVTRLMILLKVCRAANGIDPDHDVDAAGYASLAAELNETESFVVEE